MNRTLCSTLLVAAAALAGCDQSDQSTTAGNLANDQANAADAAPLQLPPSIAHSSIYRCKDNSVVYIDWLSDNKSANYRTERNAAPIQLIASEAGQKMVGPEGYGLTGTAAAGSITLERPGMGAQVCKA